MPIELEEVEKYRARRLWRRAEHRVRNRAQARAFVESAGFALLFPSPGTELPSLWEAYTDKPFELGWGDDVSTLWAWKDELPARREAASGPYFRGKASLIAPRLLGPFVSLAKAPKSEEELVAAPADADSKAIFKALLRYGPKARIELRRLAGLDGKSASRRFGRVVETLERTFRLAKVGVEQEAESHWPSQVYDLFVRAFPQAAVEARDLPRDQVLQLIVRAHFEAVAVARARPIANALSVRTREVDKAFATLTQKGVIEAAGPAFPESSFALAASARRRVLLAASAAPVPAAKAP
jgi:hypothetical protein